jgi:hypothetical protein
VETVKDSNSLHLMFRLEDLEQGIQVAKVDMDPAKEGLGLAKEDKVVTQAVDTQAVDTQVVRDMVKDREDLEGSREGKEDLVVREAMAKVDIQEEAWAVWVETKALPSHTTPITLSIQTTTCQYISQIISELIQTIFKIPTKISKECTFQRLQLSLRLITRSKVPFRKVILTSIHSKNALKSFDSIVIDFHNCKFSTNFGIKV